MGRLEIAMHLAYGDVSAVFCTLWRTFDVGYWFIYPNSLDATTCAGNFAVVLSLARIQPR